MRGLRLKRPEVAVGPGEKVLAWAESQAQPHAEAGSEAKADSEAESGVVAGTRDALYLQAVETIRLPWEQVEAADWDRDTSVLRVSEVGTWGEERAEHVLTIEEPGRLLELIRERVTASVVLQRQVSIVESRGLRVIARRAPRGDRPITWFYEYDEGIDPDDPAVVRAATDALAAARDEVGTI